MKQLEHMNSLAGALDGAQAAIKREGTRLASAIARLEGLHKTSAANNAALKSVLSSLRGNVPEDEDRHELVENGGAGTLGQIERELDRLADSAAHTGELLRELEQLV